MFCIEIGHPYKRGIAVRYKISRDKHARFQSYRRPKTHGQAIQLVCFGVRMHHPYYMISNNANCVFNKLFQRHTTAGNGQIFCTFTEIKLSH